MAISIVTVTSSSWCSRTWSSSRDIVGRYLYPIFLCVYVHVCVSLAVTYTCA